MAHHTFYWVASLGHVAVGMLAGRLAVPGERSRAALAMFVFSGLALLPDLDYVAVMLGMPDAGPCGHRGATHSLIPPLLVALLAFAVAPRLRVARWKAAALAFAVVASHPLLDAMTVSSRGVPLLWPVTFARFEMPWRPIPNAPCGLDFISVAGLQVASIELLQFLPLLLLALWPPQPAVGVKLAPRLAPPSWWLRLTRKAIGATGLGIERG